MAHEAWLASRVLRAGDRTRIHLVAGRETCCITSLLRGLDRLDLASSSPTLACGALSGLPLLGTKEKATWKGGFKKISAANIRGGNHGGLAHIWPEPLLRSRPLDQFPKNLTFRRWSL